MEHTPEQMLWHPVVADAQLADAPLPVTLLGQSLVLWRDHSGQPHAWADRCPHRGARLSMGEVATASCGSRRLVCPYHGWQFEAGGACRVVPAQPAWTPPPGHGATVHEIRQAHGLLWVRLAPPHDGLPASLLQPPVFDAASRSGWRFVLTQPYAVATSAPRLVENFLDMSHFGFVHAGWLGDADHAQVEVGQVEESVDGLEARHCRAWQPRAYAGATGSQEVAYRYRVAAPFAAVLHKEATQPGGPSNAIGLFINPVGQEQCVAWFAMATHQDPSTDAELCAFQDAVFAQDKPVVESQQPLRLPISTQAAGPGTMAKEVHGPADRLSSAYRRYLLRLGVTVGVC